MSRLPARLTLSAIGCANRVAFRLTGGRWIPYRFTGMPSVLLVTTDADGTEKQSVVPCLPDGPAHILLTGETHVRHGAARDFGRSEEIPAGATVVAHVAGRTYHARVVALRGDPGEVMRRLLKRLNRPRRYEVRCENLLPFARLEPTTPPAGDVHRE